jgi:hypothetical protein
MRIAYDTTIDEIADTYERAYRRTPSYGKTRARGTFLAGATSGGLLYLAFTVADTSLYIRSLGMISAAIIAAIWTWKNYPRNVLKHYKKEYQRMLPEIDRRSFTVELSDNAIWTQLGDTEMIFKWSNLDSIYLEDDVIQFNMKDGGLVLIHARAFDNSGHKEAFAHFANQRMEATRDTRRGFSDQ